MKKILLISSIILLLSTYSYSQRWSRYKYELFYGGGATNFMCDVATPKNPNQLVWVNLWNTIGYTLNAGLRYNYYKRNYVAANVFMGQLYAEDPKGDDRYWDRGLITNSFFTEITARYEYMVFKDKGKKTVYKQFGESWYSNINLPTYVFVGFGLNFNLGNFTEKSDDGFHTNETFYTNAAAVIPVGIGFKYKINRLTYINLESSWRFALGDGIDNALGRENQRYGKWIDQYQTITVNLIKKIRQNVNGTPRLFKKRKYRH